MARKDPNTCNTCRRRKVKCDGTTPNCANCTKLQLRCEKPTVDYRFLIHTHQRLVSQPSPLPASSCEYELSPVTPEPGVAPDRCQPHAAELSKLSPRAALESPEIARLFAHFDGTLASWYDLNDSTCTFGVVVTARALDLPVLFRAIIALSSSHWFKITGSLQEFAFAFYAACVEDLLSALDNSSDFPGEYLAAACLLQLYEILNESSQSPCHLLGAYSFSTAIHIDLSSWNLPQAGYWNYLREEVTIGMALGRPVRISKEFTLLRDMMTRESTGDDMRANLITYILARAVNLYGAFSNASGESNDPHWKNGHFTAWTDLKADLALWQENLPATFQPFSKAPKPGNMFPSEWMLKRWHVCALQYAAVAEILLILSSPEPQTESNAESSRLIEKLSIRVCGLAFTNEDLAAMINSFGPLIFCGRFLREERHRAWYEALLINLSKPTGYPIKPYIEHMKLLWAESSCI